VLELRSHVPAESADPIVERLSRTPGLSHLTLIPLATTSSVVIQAELDPVHADAILAELESMGLTGESTLIRHATIPIGEQAGRPDDSFIWTDLVAEARVSSRAAPRYLALMAVAGIIAAMGILDSNTTLIVGAMAVAPDLLPIVAACVGLAGRRSRLFARGFLSLAAGMAMASFAAGAVTAVLIAIGWTERAIVPEVTFIGSLLSVNITSVIIATAAGVAGVLAYETRGSAAVGVAISVTTIPATAFIGVALAFGSVAGAMHGLGVLSLNVVCLLAGGTTTVLVQRLLQSSGATPTRPA
jgi:uncharacterized hydrophobic protein (TIGR00271 family)